MMWTEEMTDRLRELFYEGVSATGIAIDIGHGLTRNAVIGKWHRLGLERRVKPSGVADRPRKPRRRGWTPPSFEQREAAMDEVAKRIPSITKDKAWLPLNGHPPVALQDIGQGQCRWPIGEPVMFCGEEVCEIGPYCAAHKKLAYQPGRLSTPSVPIQYTRKMSGLQIRAR